MIVQTASLNILATNYDEASAAIEKLAAAHGGYVEKLDAKAQTGNARELTAALRIPTKQLDGFLADVRKLGHVEEETRSNEEVSDQYVDLQARLKSARATEQRLIELLGTRTGKLQDVLEAERELARIRGEIESMQGQSTILVHRVNYATVQVDLSEEYRQVLGSGPISTGTKIRNARWRGLLTSKRARLGLWFSCLRWGRRSCSGWRFCWCPGGLPGSDSGVGLRLRLVFSSKEHRKMAATLSESGCSYRNTIGDSDFAEAKSCRVQQIVRRRE